MKEMNTIGGVKTYQINLPLLVVVFGFMMLVPIKNWLGSNLFIQSFTPGINLEVSYQITTLILTGLVLLVLCVSQRKNFITFFQKGNLDAEVKPVKWLGINPKTGEGWVNIGLSLAMVISLVTAVIIYFQIISGTALNTVQFVTALPIAIALSASNAFVEESLTRFGVIVSLKGKVPDNWIMLFSSILFGSLHYWGNPGGVAGVLAAGFLGWLLAKSVLETRGLFWAWFIHFLQDVIILTAVFGVEV